MTLNTNCQLAHARNKGLHDQLHTNDCTALCHKAYGDERVEMTTSRCQCLLSCTLQLVLGQHGAAHLLIAFALQPLGLLQHAQDLCMIACKRCFIFAKCSAQRLLCPCSHAGVGDFSAYRYALVTAMTRSLPGRGSCV